MSKPRYNWWPMALNIIHDYPARVKQLQDLQVQSIVADNTGMPKGGNAGRAVESLAMKELPNKQDQREYEAVHKALLRTKGMRAGKVRMDIIKLTMWRGYTIPGAALIVNETPETTRRYRWQFVMLVGCMYGFITEEEFREAVKKDWAGKNWNSKAKKM